MSEPTYAVDLLFDAHSETLPWDAKVIRLSDGAHVHTLWGTTKVNALDKAREWIKREENPEVHPPETVYLNSDGTNNLQAVS